MWHYYWKSLGGSTIGNRGLGMWGNYLFLDTPDQHLVSLDAATGKERWNQQKADYRGDLYATTAPTVIGNHVFTPAGGDYTDVPGLARVEGSGNRRAAVEVVRDAARGGTGDRNLAERLRRGTRRRRALAAGHLRSRARISSTSAPAIRSRC